MTSESVTIDDIRAAAERIEQSVEDALGVIGKSILVGQHIGRQHLKQAFANVGARLERGVALDVAVGAVGHAAEDGGMRSSGANDEPQERGADAEQDTGNRQHGNRQHERLADLLERAEALVEKCVSH